MHPKKLCSVSIPHLWSSSRILSVVMAFLLQPCAAFAYGIVVEEDGTGRFSFLGQGLVVFVNLLVLLLAPLALNWLARAAWKAKFKSAPPFDILSVSAIYAAVLLGLVAIYVLPSFKALFESFGNDLPWMTLLLINNRFLLLVPGIILLLMLYILRRSPRRETYFGAILASEVVLLLVCVVELYMPIFDYGQAV